MLPIEFQDIVARDFEIKLSKRRQSLNERIEIAQNTAALNGRGASGPLAKNLQKLYADASEEIFNDLWCFIAESLDVYQIAPTNRLATDLKDFITTKLEPIIDEFNRELQHKIRLMGLGDSFTLTMDEARDTLMKSAGVEVDRTIQELKNSGITKTPQKSFREDIVDVKPNFFGLGLNLNALWRRFGRKFSDADQ